MKYEFNAKVPESLLDKAVILELKFYNSTFNTILIQHVPCRWNKKKQYSL